MAIDAGYISYSERSRVNQGENHNIILVNGSAPLTTSPVEVFLENAFEHSGFMYGRARTSYSSMNLLRHFMLVDSNFIFGIDEISRSSSAEFTFLCHGNAFESSGGFTRRPQGGIWSKDSVRLSFYIDAPNGLSSCLYESATHETGYNTWADHTVVKAKKSGTSLVFISVLYPYLAREDSLNITLPAIDGLSCLRFGARGKELAGSFRSDIGNFLWWGDAELAEFSGRGKGALVLAYSESPDELKSCFALDSDTLRFNGSLVFLFFRLQLSI